MPSYYDSTKKKPGKAKLKYNEGGKVKNGDRTVTNEDRRRDAQIKKEVQESIALLRREGKFKTMSAADRAARNKKEDEAWDAEYERRKKDKQRAKQEKTAPKSRVKKMAGGRKIIARGSGAARTQYFRTNW